MKNTKRGGGGGDKTAIGICLSGNPEIPGTNRLVNGGKKKEKQNSQKITITLPFFISNRPKITLQHNNFVLYTFYKNASFSIAMTTFTLKLIPACCKKHHACKEWWEPSYAKEWVINIYIYIYDTQTDPASTSKKLKPPSSKKNTIERGSIAMQAVAGAPRMTK